MLSQQKMDDSETDEDWDEKVGRHHQHIEGRDFLIFCFLYKTGEESLALI